MKFDDLKQATAIPRIASARKAGRFVVAPATREELSGDWRPGVRPEEGRRPRRPDPFAQAQKERLLELRATLVQSMNEVARETRVEFSDSSVFATHHGDAGSDACDRNLAFCLLSQENDVLTQIDEALGRIESGEYGICEMSGRRIPLSRLKAIPFARFTVECQAEIEERREASRGRTPLSAVLAFDEETKIDDRDESALQPGCARRPSRVA